MNQQRRVRSIAWVVAGCSALAMTMASAQQDDGGAASPLPPLAPEPAPAPSPVAGKPAEVPRHIVLAALRQAPTFNPTVALPHSDAPDGAALRPGRSAFGRVASAPSATLPPSDGVTDRIALTVLSAVTPKQYSGTDADGHLQRQTLLTTVFDVSGDQLSWNSASPGRLNIAPVGNLPLGSTEPAAGEEYVVPSGKATLADPVNGTVFETALADGASRVRLHLQDNASRSDAFDLCWTMTVPNSAIVPERTACSTYLRTSAEPAGAVLADKAPEASDAITWSTNEEDPNPRSVLSCTRQSYGADNPVQTSVFVQMEWGTDPNVFYRDGARQDPVSANPANHQEPTDQPVIAELPNGQSQLTWEEINTADEGNRWTWVRELVKGRSITAFRQTLSMEPGGSRSEETCATF